MKRLIMVASALALAGALYGVYPYWTLHRVVKAVEGRDAETLSQLIEWTRLRESLKSQIQLMVLDKIDRKADGFSALGGMLGAAIADKMIDAMVSPAGLKRLYAGPRPPERRQSRWW